MQNDPLGLKEYQREYDAKNCTVEVFKPTGSNIHRLVKLGKGGNMDTVEIYSQFASIKTEFTTRTKKWDANTIGETHLGPTEGRQAVLGFERSQASILGRPAYDPRDLLKLYLYGYLNRIRSSHKLESEASRNLEVIWLISGLKPERVVYHNGFRDR